METLIELYDERALENVIGPETFRPKRIFYLCPSDIFRDRHCYNTLVSFFAGHDYHPTIEFVECSVYKADKIYAQLLKITDMYPECALEVTGGTDAALIAAGMCCQKNNTPTFTYSRRKNSFYDINNAAFADNVVCALTYSVEDFFTMTGGELRQGRVDNAYLKQQTDSIEDFFGVFLAHKREWVSFISYMQRLTAISDETANPLAVSGSYYQKGDRGRSIAANEMILAKLNRIGYISELRIEAKERVSFRIKNEHIRLWLRDVGSALEIYMYMACVMSGIFNDVVSSAIVDWNAFEGRDSVSNEIDVVASSGIIPLFISCKACEIKTEALNELKILSDRFGGKGAKAAIVTSEKCNSATRHRAAQLGITVIDIEELRTDYLIDRIKNIMSTKS